MVIDFFRNLLDTSSFPPRWYCGQWTSWHGWFHILSDIGIAAAYFTIPVMLWLLTTRREKIRFRAQLLLFALFIFFCGSTHLMEAVIFWWPAYRLAGTLKFLTAVVSWASVLSLVRIAPMAMRMRSHDELEREVHARQQAERKLVELNTQLEERVQARVRDLAAANKELHEQREWLRTTLASIGDAVIATDSQGRVTMLNDVATRLTGWSSESAVGQPLEKIFHIVHESTGAPVDNPALRALSQQTIVGMSHQPMLIARDGTHRPIADSAAPIRDAHGQITGAVLVFRDVTETRRLEEQYRHAQKMEAIGRFAGGIAHDFNNLLTVINGYCQLMEGQDVWDESSRDYLNEIHRAGNRAASLTQQLLAFSRMQLVQPKVLDLNEVVGSISRMLRRLIGEDIHIEMRLADQLGHVRADRGQIEQILVNLAVNARDAMPAGGQIQIITCNTTLPSTDGSNAPDAPPGDYIQLSFRDTGSGMNDQVRERAFEPFFTTKEPGKGTGLGLATVFGIVKQSKGYITLNSKPGIGTQFDIYFPRTSHSPEVLPAAPADVVTTATGTETILVVEDDEMVHNLTCHILRSAGYQVLEACNGREAEEMIHQHSGRIDLVVSDVIMPEMSGRQLRENLRAARPDLCVLLVSGYTAAQAPGPGSPIVDDEEIIAKPFSSETLLRKVRQVIDGAHR